MRCSLCLSFSICKGRADELCSELSSDSVNKPTDHSPCVRNYTIVKDHLSQRDSPRQAGTPRGVADNPIEET